MARLGFSFFLAGCKQIEKQSSQACLTQCPRHKLIPGTVPTASAAMRKDHNALRIIGDHDVCK
jgi:hypothetical protein